MVGSGGIIGMIGAGSEGRVYGAERVSLAPRNRARR